MSAKRFLRIEPELCIATTGCRECVVACPDRALTVVGGLPRGADGQLCEVAETCVVACVEECPTGAASVQEGGD